MIVEIKDERFRDDTLDGTNGAKALAIRAWETLNPAQLKYEMIFTATDRVPFDRLSGVLKFAEEPEMYLPIRLDRDRIGAFCRKWNVERLELFGSVLRDDFRADSDVDFLYTCKPGAPVPGLLADDMQAELAAIVGREVDLVSRKWLERSQNWMRRKSILESARVIYGA
jgi:hypothetical protein